LSLHDALPIFCGVRGGSGEAFWDLKATYAGLVRETRRSLTTETGLIDALRKPGEAINVDFKREVHTGTNEQIADLMKDVLALANTPLTGAAHCYIIGVSPPDDTAWGRPV